MGISGLLPALKSIQKTKNLSEFSGQTIAVDAYVWLHKAIYTCAPELATGKPTTRYVDFVMRRVRLLRHHNIEPYLVFDGGPLPAKKHTEESRRRKRDESLAMAKSLEAQGKKTLARDHYLKCVDVSPQMAYQVIKALKADSVSYVVAPYEADAQMTFLERSGIVDAVMTEDSDLLVFGCQHTLFKFDPSTSTVVSIHRKDFGSVTTSTSDGAISLVGWSDFQFRSMAILSGCDYLPSIPGIGLKTACTLLRKFKSPDQVIKMIALEGKKPVPKGYLARYKLADKCFLHQRVYDPVSKQLVHLTDIGSSSSEWDDETDTYVGRPIEASIAHKIAQGMVHPETYEQIEDTNPEYRSGNPNRVTPLAPRTGKLNSKGTTKHPNGPNNATSGPPPRSGGILSFFGSNPIIPPRVSTGKNTPTSTETHVASPSRALEKKKPRQHQDQDQEDQEPQKRKKTKSKSPDKERSRSAVKSGSASGKRTLAEVMEEGFVERKRPRTSDPFSPPVEASSRFFSSLASSLPPSSTLPLSLPDPPPAPDLSHQRIESVPSTTPNLANKENVFDLEDASSIVGNHPSSERNITDVDGHDLMEVIQEDGYLSPWASSRNTPNLSSPIQATSLAVGGGGGAAIAAADADDDDECNFVEDSGGRGRGSATLLPLDGDEDVDPVSSPVHSKSQEWARFAFDATAQGWIKYSSSGSVHRGRDGSRGENNVGFEEVLVASTPSPGSPSRSKGRRSVATNRRFSIIGMFSSDEEVDDSAGGEGDCTEIGKVTAPAMFAKDDGEPKVSGTYGHHSFSSILPAAQSTPRGRRRRATLGDAYGGSCSRKVGKQEKEGVMDACDDKDVDEEVSDPEDQEAKLHARRQAIVAQGWRHRFSHSSSQPGVGQTLATRTKTWTPPARDS